jgi:putative transposase
MLVRLVSSAGTFWFRDKHVFLSNALEGERIGLEEVDDGIWNIVYYSTLLGRIEERTFEITGV